MGDGYAGSFLRVDLTKGKTAIESTPKELKRRWLGGVGIGAWLLWGLTDAGIDPLSPDNPLIMLTGPVNGTLFPQSARYICVSRSPLTGWWAHSSAGGFFGPELKYAGYDFIIITGRSGNGAYIDIRNDAVEVRSAEHLWGLDVLATTKVLEEETGDPDTKVACIGPGGENLVKFACIMSDRYRAVGRTGLGCVMGSKNLKAIAVRGTKGIAIANSDRFDRLLEDYFARYTPKGRYWEYVDSMRKYGTFALTDWENAIGRLPTKNHWTGYFENAEQTIGMEPMRRRHYRGHKSCFNCAIQCKYVSRVEGGKFAGSTSEGPEYETVEAFTSNFLNPNTDYLIRANQLCNLYGLDTISTGHAISWACECCEHGLLTKDDTLGRDLRWGEDGMDAVIELVDSIARRKDKFASLLAEGCAAASRAVGKGSEAYAIHVNNLESSGQDGRPHKSMGLTYAINVRGSDHLTSISCIDELGYREEAVRRYGKELADIICDKWDERYKGFLVAETEELNCLADTLLLCKYGVMWPPIYYFRDFCDIISAITGFKEYEKPSELSNLTRRIVHLRRAFNVRLGWSKANDSLHPRYTKEPMPTGPAKGQVVNLEPMLQEYYEDRRYDWKTGWPTRGELERVGLNEVSDYLQRAGRLGDEASVPKSGRKLKYWAQRPMKGG